MNNIIKKGFLVSLGYLTVILVLWVAGYALKVFLGPDTPFTILTGVPIMIISIFGIFLAPIVLPTTLCNPSGFMGCESLFGGLFSIFLNLIFFFFIGATISFIFRSKDAKP